MPAEHFPVVFVVQLPWPDRNTGQAVRDFTPAERYGKLKILLAHDHGVTDDLADDLLDAGLKAWHPGDFLLCSGHPVAIGVATAIAASRGFPVRLLVWSGRTRAYDVVTADPRSWEDPAVRKVAVGRAGTL